VQEDFLGSWLRRSLYAAVFGLLAQVSLAQNAPPVALDTNETLFAVLTAVNTCGYDQELNLSDSLRVQIRGEVAKAIQGSEEAREATKALCQFYDDHQKLDAARTLAQYVSLAMFLGPPPEFTPTVKEGDIAPDANALLGGLQLLGKFYTQAGLHNIWLRHQREYNALTDRYHEPLSKMLFDTEIYLKLPSAGYLGHQFTVYLDPMGAPGQTNARQYGSNYYVVISPGTSSSLKMQQIRHTYLHYLLDPMALKYPTQLKRLDPLLEQVKTSPMDENFKSDSALLVTECLIRAIEARTLPRTTEEQREKTVNDSVHQGFILTPYFYEALTKFEKDPAGLRNTYGEMLADIDIRKELKQASQVQFASNADPELLHLTRPMEGKLLNTAEQRLSVGDVGAAQKLAQEALDEKSEDEGHALFILARVASTNGDMKNAQNYFQRALTVAREPKVLAWSHIYLGRIFDLQEERDAAMDQYRSALNAAGAMPEVKAAAERGLQQPYEPPHPPQQKD